MTIEIAKRTEKLTQYGKWIIVLYDFFVLSVQTKSWLSNEDEPLKFVKRK